MSDGNPTQTLRWGLLAAGTIAADFAAGVRGSRFGDLRAVAARSLDRARAFAAANDVPVAHGSYEQLLADDSVDAVYVSTPHPLHARWSIAALRAGKHVLCEKPMAMNAAQAEAVLEEARRAERFFMEGFMYRFHPQTLAWQNLLATRAIGEVRSAEVVFSFDASGAGETGRLFDPALGGGAILDVGCYCTSVSRLIAALGTGADGPVEPEELTAVGVVRGGIDRRSAAGVVLPGGVVATLRTAIDVHEPDRIEICGSEGSLTVTDLCWLPPQRGGRSTTITVTRPNGQVDTTTVPSGRQLFSYEVDHVAEHVVNGQSPVVTWAESLANLRTLDRWRAAIGLTYPVETQDGNTGPVDGGPLRPNREPRIPSARLEPLGRDVSRVVMGVDAARTPTAAAVMWDRFLELGGSMFDTGWLYEQGRAPERLGWWIESRGVRDQVAILDKGAHTPVDGWPLTAFTDCTPEQVTRQHLQDLERLRTDHVDVWMFHRDNLAVPVGEFVDVVNRHVATGTMRTWGVSNWSLERIQGANAYAAEHGLVGVQAVSNQFSLARWTNPVWPGAATATGDGFTAWLRETGTPLLPWSSQARGYFVGEPAGYRPRDFADRAAGDLEKYWNSPDNEQRKQRVWQLAAELGTTPVSVALAWVLAQSFPVFPLIGPRSLGELDSSTRAFDLALTDEQVRRLDLR